jgi:transposase
MVESRISYRGKTVYVGIDVHKETYSVTCMCNKSLMKKATLEASPDQLAVSLRRWFEGAKIQSAYEAGFSGFGLHRILVKAGIKNIVVNAGSIAVASNDRVKTDPRDSAKIATQLEAAQLRGIYIPTEQEEYRRTLSRGREQTVAKRGVIARQIKSKLHYFGLMRIDDARLISNRYLNEIAKKKLAPEVQYAFSQLSEEWRFYTLRLIKLRKKLQEQAQSDSKLEAVYRSVPGVGLVSARVFANELGDLSRFNNERALFQYTGLTPSEYSSGNSVRRGPISRQGAARIRALLVEVAWRAVGQDPALKKVFDRIASTRGSKRAIVAIARKLIGRIRACFRTGAQYAIETYV